MDESNQKGQRPYTSIHTLLRHLPSALKEYEPSKKNAPRRTRTCTLGNLSVKVRKVFSSLPVCSYANCRSSEGGRGCRGLVAVDMPDQFPDYVVAPAAKPAAPQQGHWKYSKNSGRHVEKFRTELRRAHPRNSPRVLRQFSTHDIPSVAYDIPNGISQHPCHV